MFQTGSHFINPVEMSFSPLEISFGTNSVFVQMYSRKLYFISPQAPSRRSVGAPITSRRPRIQQETTIQGAQSCQGQKSTLHTSANISKSTNYLLLHT